MIRSSLIFILIYFSGRLWFYPVTRILNDRAVPVQIRYILFRIAWGGLFFLLAEDICSAVLLMLLHITAILLDTYLTAVRKKWKATAYLMHILYGLLIIPAVIPGIESALKCIHNPLQSFLFEWIMPAFSSAFRETGITFNAFIIILAGYIFTLKEATILIRLTLKRIRVTPKIRNAPDKPDLIEYERGRLIGILERTFFYFLIILNQIPSLAIIIALKSLARFRELENKEFAEYFLIGSLLSLLWAIIPAILGPP